MCLLVFIQSKLKEAYFITVYFKYELSTNNLYDLCWSPDSSNIVSHSLFQQTNFIIPNPSLSAPVHSQALARTFTTITHQSLFSPAIFAAEFVLFTNLPTYLFLGPAIFSSNAYNGGPLHYHFLNIILLL